MTAIKKIFIRNRLEILTTMKISLINSIKPRIDEIILDLQYLYFISLRYGISSIYF